MCAAKMNFEGFKDLMHRVARSWLQLAKRKVTDIDKILDYLADDPFSAKQTANNEEAYEELMDVRMQLLDLSFEIDTHHNAYMEFMEQVLEAPDLLKQLTDGIPKEEKHLIHLELMIMEQVQDWEFGTGKVDQESGQSISEWTKEKRMVVTLPNGGTKTLTMTQVPHKRYWFGVCAVTSKIGNVKVCGGCKVVGYIGKDEQSQDWPNHKNLCKILKKARGDAELWTEKLTSDQMQELLRLELNRELNQFEVDITTFPRVCMITGSGAQQAEMRNCKNCFCVAFSPERYEEGMTLHGAEDCKALKTAAEDYKNEITLGHQVQHFVPQLLMKHKALPPTIEEFFQPEVASLVSNKLPGYQDSELRYLTFLYTCQLTVLYAAEQIGQLRTGPLDALESLTIHIVGTRIAELRHLNGWEIIACRLPKLRQLNLVFIGDETVASEFPPRFTYKGKELQAQRKNLTIDYYLEPPCLYQAYLKRDSFIDPDMIVALDCGFKFYPTWRPALVEMLRIPKCPLVFTEFTLEDQKDNLNLIQSMADAEVCIAPKKNPFCSRRPVRCSDKSGNYKPHSVIYTNDFICAVKGKQY
eukprot:TCALIF_01648-PA protein Name:"Protein of unknown function" AED:0.01 eAED:0.10 QI:51/0.5/0.66/1/1/1/3/0/582